MPMPNHRDKAPICPRKSVYKKSHTTLTRSEQQCIPNFVKTTQGSNKTDHVVTK